MREMGFMEKLLDGAHVEWKSLASCSVPCDHVPIRSWALFRARDVMRGVMESFNAEQPR